MRDNTEFRIVVDGVVVMQTNTGGAAQMAYHEVSMHGVTSTLAAGTHTAEVQCKLPVVGRVAFESNGFGPQDRRLSVIEAPPSDLGTMLVACTIDSSKKECYPRSKPKIH